MMPRVPKADKEMIKYMCETFCMDNLGGLRFNPKRPKRHFARAGDYSRWVRTYAGQQAGVKPAKGVEQRVNFGYQGERISRSVCWIIRHIKGKCDVINLSQSNNKRCTKLDFTKFSTVFGVMDECLRGRYG